MGVGKMNRQQRKELGRRLQSPNPGLEVVHPHAAGIDVGNGAHYIAVRPERDAEPVRRFECFTADLYRMADWLGVCEVKTVAMQSTGVYWIPLYEILEQRGFEVYLVNARHTKNLPGRKSDVQESQWLLKLHPHGLLNNSFQPTAEIRVVRTYWRQRGAHVHGASTCIQRMQKVLTQMNVQLANVISDLSGMTGQAIVRAGHDLSTSERLSFRFLGHRQEAGSLTNALKQSAQQRWISTALYTNHCLSRKLDVDRAASNRHNHFWRSLLLLQVRYLDRDQRDARLAQFATFEGTSPLEQLVRVHVICSKAFRLKNFLGFSFLIAGKLEVHKLSLEAASVVSAIGDACRHPHNA